MLFLSAIEPLACLIRSSPNLAGISLGGEALLKIIMYADDTTLLLLQSRAELAEAERLLKIFEDGSGAKDKSELIPMVLGHQHALNSRPKNTKLYPMPCSGGCI